MKTYYSNSNYGLELELTAEQAQRGHHQGQCDDDVEGLMPELKAQLDKIDPATLRKELKEYGAWNERELSDHKENLLRFVWIACGDVTEQIFDEQRAVES